MNTIAAKTSLSFKNILYATDFSSAAEAALPFVSEIARLYDSQVLGVHVRTPDSYSLVPPPVFPYGSESTDEQLKNLSSMLEEQLQGTKHEIMVGDGEVWDFLSRVLREYDIDLIVIGTQGRTGLEKFMLGSQAEVIFRQAECPVLTVGPHATKEAAAHWNINRILLPLDFTLESLSAVPLAFPLACERHAELTLMNVVEKGETGDLVRPEQYVDSTLRMLQAQVPKGAEFECRLNYVVRQGVPSEEILKVAKEIGSDLIVLGVRSAAGRIGFATHVARPTAHKVVSQAMCPVLTVRG
ncbi:MAG: universal stress protein [Candidatus Acidiferrum sp.]